MSLLEEVVKESSLGLDLGNRLERIVASYVRRRAGKLIAQHSDWDRNELTSALIVERAVVGTYARTKTAQLVSGTDPKTPPHLDLAVMAKVSSGTQWYHDAARRVFTTRYPQLRSDWIWEIVWRAVAVHDDVLWQSPGLPRKLETEALDELVDRRLRVVERMTYNVNTSGFLHNTRDRAWFVAGPNGPWNDRMLVRIFEYPFLPKAKFLAHLSEMEGWREDVSGQMIIYRPRRKAPVHVPTRISESWGFSTETFGDYLYFKPTASTTPSAVIESMFELGHQDFLDRSWLYCDQVGTALLVEALWFGRSRRDNNTAAFDTLLNEPSYVGFGNVLGRTGGTDKNILMADADDDPYFENTAVDFDELQVGDFVVFWNNRIYSLISSGAWQNEYSFVMRTDPDPHTGKMRVTRTGPQLWLAGHGLDTTLYNGMATEITRYLGELLDEPRTEIMGVVDANPDATEVDNSKYVRWAPYEDFDPPGPWWLVIPQTKWMDDWGHPNHDAAITAIPRTLADDPAGGMGYHHPPFPTAIYFPLWEPKVSEAVREGADGDSWRAYLRKRKADPAYRAPRRLDKLTVDSRLAPGLFYRGTKAKVPVVRPRVKR